MTSGLVLKYRKGLRFVIQAGYKAALPGSSLFLLTKPREMFEKNGCEIVDSAQPAHNQPPPLCYSSVWLSMNVLVLDPKTVCVEKSEVYQAEQMDKLGMEVVEVDLRDAYAFGGGLHCCTADVYREGSCEDYFPHLS